MIYRKILIFFRIFVASVVYKSERLVKSVLRKDVMKMRRVIAFIIAFVFLFSTVAFAATTAVGKPSLTFSGTTANCSITVTQSGEPISVTLELYQGSTLIDSWSKSGSSRVKVSGSATVSSGLSYRLEAHGTINGVPFTATPVTKTCP